MISHSFPRGEGDVAGAFIWRLGEALVARGHIVTVVAPADRGDTGAALLGKVRVRRFRYASPAQETLAHQGNMHQLAATPLGAITFARLVRAMSKAATAEIRASAAHVVHAHWWVPGGLAVRLGDRAGRPLMITLHGTDVALAKKLPGGRGLMRSVLRQASVVSAVSSFLAGQAAETLKVPLSAIPLTPMPMALGRLGDPDAARSGVIFVGRLTRQKGVHHLLEALSILKRQGQPLDLTRADREQLMDAAPDSLIAASIAAAISASDICFGR